MPPTVCVCVLIECQLNGPYLKYNLIYYWEILQKITGTETYGET